MAKFIELLPKIFHQIWLGNAPIPDEYITGAKQWQFLHPGWKYKLWRDADIPSLNLKNQNIYDAFITPGIRGDVARYEILQQFGGIYLDTDMFALRPLTYFFGGLPNDTQGFLGLQDPNCIGNAIMGAAPHAAWVDALVDRLPGSIAKHLDNIKLDPKWICDASGPTYVNTVLRDRTDITVMPRSIFYHEPGDNHRCAMSHHGCHGSWRAFSAQPVREI